MQVPFDAHADGGIVNRGGLETRLTKTGGFSFRRNHPPRLWSELVKDQGQVTDGSSYTAIVKRTPLPRKQAGSSQYGRLQIATIDVETI